MYDFNYHRPASLDAAIALRASAADGTYLAGGMTLIPTLKQRLASPSDVIDLAALPGLSGIEVGSATVVIGAMTRHAEVAASKPLAAAIPALAYLAAQIGDRQVRQRGTLGGSVANSDPSADYPAAVVGLGATIHTNQRAIAADDFFKSMFETALQPGELIVRIEFPIATTTPAEMESVIGGYAAKGIRVLVLATFRGTLPTPAQA
ncbi:MAG: FAD binding domain-containing protein, partial [Caulobacterales bacterium]